MFPVFAFGTVSGEQMQNVAIDGESLGHSL
jgi:hypothetical protein